MNADQSVNFSPLVLALPDGPVTPVLCLKGRRRGKANRESHGQNSYMARDLWLSVAYCGYRVTLLSLFGGLTALLSAIQSVSYSCQDLATNMLFVWLRHRGCPRAPGDFFL